MSRMAKFVVTALNKSGKLEIVNSFSSEKKAEKEVEILAEKDFNKVFSVEMVEDEADINIDKRPTLVEINKECAKNIEKEIRAGLKVEDIIFAHNLNDHIILIDLKEKVSKESRINDINDFLDLTVEKNLVKYNVAEDIDTLLFLD
ncbi:hypothetical protein [uncultured Clostridium sp.]|uniref:hypothetical protein n=1 Tax=uncultured Clostridium sp. TaxID=59620 RepID=UPI0026104292|nr:hypothetical protein [uncultured Clostridium sp.]